MSHHHRPDNSRAVAWALLSQSVWLPVVGIDLHDRWQAASHRARPLALPQPELAASLPPLAPVTPRAVVRPSLGSGSSASSAGVLLGASASMPSVQVGHLVDGVESPPSPGNAPMQRRPSGSLSGVSTDSARTLASAVGSLASGSRYDLLQRSFTPSELLGGALSLSDLQSAPAPAIALSERARLARSSDPLAPLPQAWREPMRRALHAITLSTPLKPPAQLEAARVVHVPSLKVMRTTAVPLALQSDGSVDLLSKPDDPAVLEAIRGWSGRQDLPASGRMAPAIVHVEPLKELPPLRSVARSSSSAPSLGPSTTHSQSSPAVVTPAASLNPKPSPSGPSPVSEAPAASPAPPASGVAETPVSTSQPLPAAEPPAPSPALESTPAPAPVAPQATAPVPAVIQPAS
jgi:hypothetical protein